MKKGRLLKRGLASLLAAVLAVGLLPMMPCNMAAVKAADGGKTIAGLGTGVIADPTEPTEATNAWQGSYVYFGSYDTDGDGTAEPVKYRVLDHNTSVFGGTTMLLDCDSILETRAFDDGSNIWADSNIRTYLNGTFLTSNFSTAEQSAIASSTKSEAVSDDGDGWVILEYTPLSGEQIFFLDAQEATNTKYGYSNTYQIAANREKTVKTGGEPSWWLRSTDVSRDLFCATTSWDGSLRHEMIDMGAGVSPTLNINLSSVLFASVISGTAGATEAEYKLTILDNNMTIAGSGDVTRSGDTVTIPYTISGTNSGNATQVSVLILDKAYTAGNTNDASILAYEKLTVDVFSEAGTGTFTLPSDLSDKVCGTDYYAYILAEDVNGETETDYASTPVSITVPASIVKHTITATAGENGSISPSGAVEVTEGNDRVFTITSNEGYEVDTLKVDGTNVDAATSYTFTNVTADHTIAVTFREKTQTPVEAPVTSDTAVPTVTENTTPDPVDSTTSTIKADTSDDGNNNRKDDVPETGDDTPVAWVFILTILAGSGVVFTEKKRKNIKM